MCKNFLGNFLEMAKKLEHEYIFDCLDRQVYGTFHLICKYFVAYNSIVMLVGNFHQLMILESVYMNFHFGVWSISYNCLRSRNETHCGCYISLRSF